MFEGHPKGLWALALANTGERFGYYTMLAVFFLFLQHNFGFSVGAAKTRKTQQAWYNNRNARRCLQGPKPIDL